MTDRELLFFLGKDIEVTLKNGVTFIGHAHDFEWGDDEFESCLGVKPFDIPGIIDEVYPGEVESIKIIERPKNKR